MHNTCRRTMSGNDNMPSHCINTGIEDVCIQHVSYF